MNIFHIYSSGSNFVWWSGTILVEGIMRNISVKLFLIWTSGSGVVCLFYLVCGFASQSSAMAMLRQSVNMTTLFPGQVYQYFVHILSLVTDTVTNQPFLNQQEENDCRKYFMINLYKSVGPCQHQIHNPWIYNSTPYQLRYRVL